MLIKTDLGNVELGPNAIDDLAELGHSIADATALVKKALTEQARQHVLEQRRQAHELEAYPLYVEWRLTQNADAEQSYRAACTEINTRYPL
ncbi:hypothetical protein JL49_09005 [Pseudoalteromonas luteoviolacea]|nr:hypothetical protein JL49_09005 [Pseudoalteromonas luteoviolacea]